MDPSRLNNRYYCLRHGQSRANISNLVVSDPENGLNDYGLTETGKQQAEAAFETWADARDLDGETLIFSSDFLRTKETAQIASRKLGCKGEICFTPLLRERFFGRFELGKADCYEGVWADDAKNLCPEESGVEQVQAVLKRGLACLEEIEARYTGRTILLVSHGDTLQILMTFFSGIPPYRHRSLPHLDTAELRRLTRN